MTDKKIVTFSPGNTCQINSNSPQKIIFSCAHKDMMTITEQSIKVHRENFPEWNPDDFANEIINILEFNYNISFERKKNNDK